MALYHALKIRELCLLTKGGKGNILEIGAGGGRSAYFSKIMGLGDYTIVDLPLSLIGQALFLSATLGDDAISLEGENDPGVEKKIRLISPKKLLESGEKFDVVMNVDSLSEMPMEQASAYLKYLSKYANVLYSMNHEGNQYRTIDIAAAVELNAAPIRHASAFRKGYVEELYFLGLSHTLGEREE
jgi:putative sugar O-methyltransferase